MQQFSILSLVATILIMLCILPVQANSYKAQRTTAEKGCDSGNANMCYKLSYMVLYGLGGPKDVKGASLLSRRACTLDHAKACFEFGLRLHEGAGGFSVNKKGARLFWKKSCKLNFAKGCDGIYTMLRDGIGGPKDIKGAVPIAQKSCNLNSGVGCFYLANIYIDNKQFKKALKYAEKSCRLKDKLGCKLAQAVMQYMESSPN